MIFPGAEGDERAPVQSKRREPIADALLRSGCGSVNGPAKFLQRCPLFGSRARENLINRFGFGFRYKDNPVQCRSAGKSALTPTLSPRRGHTVGRVQFLFGGRDWNVIERGLRFQNPSQS